MTTYSIDSMHIAFSEISQKNSVQQFGIAFRINSSNKTKYQISARSADVQILVFTVDIFSSEFYETYYETIT